MAKSSVNAAASLLSPPLPAPRRGQYVTHLAEHVRKVLASGAWPGGTLLPSAQTLAKAWGVGYVTAHRALERLTAEGLLTRRARRGTAVAGPATRKPDRANRVWLLLVRHGAESAKHPDLYFSLFIEGLQEELGRQGIVVVTVSVNGRAGEDLFLENLRQTPSDAAVVVSTDNGRLVTPLKASGLPVILVSPYVAGLHAMTVFRDEERAAREAVDYLFERGRRRIGILLRESLKQESKVRVQCLRAAIRRRRLASDPAWECVDLFSEGPPEDRIRRCLAAPRRPTAIVTIELYRPLILAEAQRLGLRLPEDLLLIVYTDRPSPTHDMPRLKLDAFDYGLAVGKIVHRAVYEEAQAWEAHAFYVPYELIEGRKQR
jgi:DNA-binding LacI/PurR family transcriptional regulator